LFLVEVPRRPAAGELPGDGELVALVRECLGDKQANGLKWELEQRRGFGDGGTAAEALREQWFGRMWDVSQFMKVLKQRFSQWFNGRHARRGTLWEERFRSVLVEGRGHALRTMAAYIDLNPVRAGICEDPKDYRWCGYGEAVAGGGQARLARAAIGWLASFDARGMERMEGMEGMEKKQRMEPAAAELAAGAAGADGTRQANKVRRVRAAAGQEQARHLEALRRWRCELFGVPPNEARQEELRARQRAGGGVGPGRERIAKPKALAVLASGGRLSRADYLRCRVRYFTDGAVLGGKDFVEGVFRAARDRFSATRSCGARPLRGLELAPMPERLYNLRQLQRGVFG
jgi:putative transposase